MISMMLLLHGLPPRANRARLERLAADLALAAIRPAEANTG
jgi:hypothetical protein